VQALVDVTEETATMHERAGSEPLGVRELKKHFTSVLRFKVLPPAPYFLLRLELRSPDQQRNTP
jgi:hypothetical protein